MSDILIRGLQLPKSCAACRLERRHDMSYDYEFRSCRITGVQTNHYFKARHPDCPLVPVPPHGDLVDKQRMAETNEQHYMVCKGEPDADYARKVVLRMLDQAPTVIPADKEESDE